MNIEPSAKICKIHIKPLAEYRVRIGPQTLAPLATHSNSCPRCQVWTNVILTSVPKVALDFGKPTQRWIDYMTASEATKHLNEG